MATALLGVPVLGAITTLGVTLGEGGLDTVATEVVDGDGEGLGEGLARVAGLGVPLVAGLVFATSAHDLPVAGLPDPVPPPPLNGGPPVLTT